jgi:macrolide-specific efflux system membrane fusion protein
VGGAFWAYETVSGPGTGNAAASSVRTVPVQRGVVTASVTADGTLESGSTAAASFVTGGTVTSIGVRVGDKVKKGQVLAEVDAAAAKRELAAAEADLGAARDSLDRAEDAGSDTSTAENEVAQAQLAVDKTSAAVDGTVLRAPMAGTVVAVNGTLGSSSGSSGGQQAAETSTASTGFIDLADLTKLQVKADFAEADATRLKEKQAATVTWNALSGAVRSGRVAAVDPQATTANDVVTYGVTLTLDKVPAGAKPGQTVSVSVVTGTAEDAVYVNSAAVTTVGNRHTVTVSSGGGQQVRTVEIGLKGDQATQIVSGVEPGEQVVITAAAPGAGGTTARLPGGAGVGGFPGGGAAPPGGGAPRGGR